MWLSKKIKKDKEAKEALKDISRSIKKYSDATKITKTKFLRIDIGSAFRPKKMTYFTSILITAIVVFLLNYKSPIDIKELRDILSLYLRVSIPILVLGITLSNAIKSIDKESRFATEYTQESCRTILFTCLTFITVLAGLIAYLIGLHENAWVSYIFFSCFVISTGGTIWCLMSQVYVIAVIIKCMDPKISTVMASNYAARETIHAFLIKTYNDIWMKKHSENLQVELHNCKKVFHYNDSYAKSILSEDSSEKYIFKFNQIVDSHYGYRDFNLKILKKIDKLLSTTDAELYLEPNFYKSNVYGTLYFKEGSQIICNVKKLVFSKFRKDKYINENNEFWDNHQEKIFNSIIKALKEHDIAQFREHIIFIEGVFNAITQVRKNDLVRKYSDFRREIFQFLKLYTRSLVWLLSSKIEDESVRDLLIKEIANSFDRQTYSYIENGDWYILDAFKWTIPNMYKQFVKHKDSLLWKKRAEIGSFYYYAGYKLSDSELKITDHQKLELQLTLHKGIISWLLVALNNKDVPLIKDLCNSAKRLVFSGKKIVLSPNDLIFQHLLLLGKYLKLLSNESPSIDKSVFNSLLFDEYEHNIEFGYTFNELIDFFIEKRKNNPREYLQEFSETNFEMRPLAGTGFGTPHNEFDGTEFDYAFIYLALILISDNEQIRPIEFWAYSLKEKINIIEKAASKIDFYGFSTQKELLEKWLDDCDNMYTEQKEQRVADADLKTKNISVFSKYFWDGYKNHNTFLKFCIKQHYYVFEDIASTSDKLRLPKTLFLEDANRCHSVGLSCGSEISHNKDNILIYNIIKSSLNKKNEAVNNIEEALNKSSRWLIDKGLREYEGIIVYLGNEYIEGKLLENEHFIPSWKMENEKYFSGYYKDFPIIKLYQQNEDQHCIALDLKGWKGIQIRNDIIEKDIFGNIGVRNLTEEEIDEAIKNDPNLKEGDRNKLKGTCAAEYELYWQLNEEKLPNQFSVFCNNKKDE